MIGGNIKRETLSLVSMLLLIVVMFWSGYEYGQRRFVEIGGVQIKQIDGEWWARVSGNSDAPAIEIGSGEMLVHSCIVDVASSRPSTLTDEEFEQQREEQQARADELNRRNDDKA